MRPWVLALGLFWVPAATPQQSESSEAEVRTVLRKNCLACHNSRTRSSGLSLEYRETILEGGNRGPAAVPGRPPESLLVKAIRHQGDLKMPPGRQLSYEDAAIIERWVEKGLPGSIREAAPAAPARSKHWAFQPLRRPDPPKAADPWTRNPIYSFVLARLAKEGLRPSEEADRATLIRRLSLDLLGLLPDIKEVEEFLADTRPDAYDRLADRLLASPHYGERWARHWLDQARYADSNGYNIDGEREMWMYRNWVIDAINRGMPFDQFVVEQVAGDLLPEPSTSQLVATGFHRNTLLNLEGGIDFEQYRVEAVADRVDATGAVFLGLTVGCARCHDHKYDPISQREYYRLFAFFNNIDELAADWGEAGRRRAHEPLLFFGSPEELAKKQAVRAQLEALERELEDYTRLLNKRLPEWEASLGAGRANELKPEIQYILKTQPEQRSDIMKEALQEEFWKTDAGYRQRRESIKALAVLEPKLASAMIMRERGKPRESYVMLGGDFLRKGIAVEPGVPAVLPALAVNGRAPNRLDLVRWLVDPSNPLTARVTVNRVWQRFFGRGFVETENDFGSQGSTPTHPELLDWLAAEFASNWQMKALHRLIVTSATYRQSARSRPELAGRDPNNELLARQSRIRLDAEIVRDAALKASGMLNPAIGGRSVFPPQPAGASKLGQIQRDWVASTGLDRFRRGMYTHFWRSSPHPNLMVFDAPDTTTACTRRFRSNTPLQALTLLNDEGFFELARGLAARVLRDAPTEESARITHAFRLCLSRNPQPEEAGRIARFLHVGLDNRVSNGAAAESAAWTAVARVLMNLDEFITRE